MHVGVRSVEIDTAAVQYRLLIYEHLQQTYDREAS